MVTSLSCEANGAFDLTVYTRQINHSPSQFQQGVDKSSLANFQEISRIHFLNSRRFLRDKPYNIKIRVKFVMSEDLLFLSIS